MHNYKVLSPPMQGTPPGGKVVDTTGQVSLWFHILSYFWQAILLPLIQSRGCKRNAYHMYGNSLYNKHSRLAWIAFIYLPQFLLHVSYLCSTLPSPVQSQDKSPGHRRS